MAMERATLYAIPGSHACMSAVLMLEHEGVDFRRVDLFTGLHPLLVRAKGFAGHRTPIRQVDGRTHRMLAMLDRGGTVPALLMSGERIQTNHDIARFLDRMSAQPALFPANPDARIEVEAAEAWGDEIFQMAARRIALAAAAHGLDAFHDRGNHGRLGPLLAPRERVRMMASLGARVSFRAHPSNEGEMLGALPAMLDRIDAWIADGVLGGEQLNVADFMIVPSLALISYRLDLRSGIESRPAGALLERLLPERPAHDRGSR
jgi:glutathione S-transferase